MDSDSSIQRDKPGNGKLTRWLAKAKDAGPTQSAIESNAARPQNQDNEPQQKVGSKLDRWLVKAQDATPCKPTGNQDVKVEKSKLSKWLSRAQTQTQPNASPSSCESTPPQAPESRPPAAGGGSKLARWMNRNNGDASPAPSAPPSAPQAPQPPTKPASKLQKWLSKAAPSADAAALSADGNGAAVTDARMPAPHCVNGVVTTGFKSVLLDEKGNAVDPDVLRTLLPSAASTDGGAPLRQDAANGYHRIPHADGGLFCGWIRDGKPSGQGSYRWADGTEYHGDFAAGRLHGAGSYFYADGAVLSSQFENDCPVGEGTLVDPDKVTFTVTHDGSRPPWAPGAAPTARREEPPQPFRPVKFECVGVRVSGAYAHVRNVTGRLVLARPQYADVPLWNAEAVKGNIVAIMRGPGLPAETVNYGVKTFYAQEAGAVGVVFVDCVPGARFNAIPRADEGPIYRGGPVLKINIPLVFTLHRYMYDLQPGAIHNVVIAPPNYKGGPAGWKIGYIQVPLQETKASLTKEMADSLMAEFFQARKAERLAEADLLPPPLDRQLNQSQGDGGIPVSQ